MNETTGPREVPSGPDRLVVEADFLEMTPETVFDYWTKPELITKWWPQEAELEPREGAATTWHGRE